MEHCTAKSVLPRDLSLWRAADSRPYADCATELASGNFGAFVGVVLSAADQHKMIAGGDHPIT